MKLRQTLLVAGMALAVVGAVSAQDVKVDFDKDANFAVVKSFTIKIGTAWGNSIGEKRVVEEITGALKEKGWTLAADGAGDVQVILHGATETKRTLNTFYSGGMGGYGYGWGGYGAAGMGMGSSSTTTSEYTVGTLVVDIFDSKTKQLMWRGSAQDELSDKPEKNAKKLGKASDKLFKNFPPGSEKKK